VPPTRSLRVLAAAARDCAGCPLYRAATRTVFGDGPRDARVVLVGEQPGDREDLNGEPFVGPAGRVLDQCLEDAGIDRTTVYLTNAVKHFKHEQRGKRRIHQRPTTEEINACKPWLTAELNVVRPAVVVALGATAARSLSGRNLPIGTSRGRRIDVDGRPMIVTYHPSAVLRGDERAATIRAALVEDLRLAAGMA
jgi:uracil-DNA glycosylase family protein